MSAFLTGLMKPIEKKIGEKHDQEEAKKKDLRSFYFKALQDPDVSAAGREEAQQQLNKLLNPEAKKGLGKLGGLFKGLGAKGASPNGQLSGPQQPATYGKALGESGLSAEQAGLSPQQGQAPTAQLPNGRPTTMQGQQGAGAIPLDKSGAPDAKLQNQAQGRGPLTGPDPKIYSDYGVEAEKKKHELTQVFKTQERQERAKFLQDNPEVGKGMTAEQKAMFIWDGKGASAGSQASKVVKGTVREGDEYKGKSFTQIVHPDGAVDWIEEAPKAAPAGNKKFVWGTPKGGGEPKLAYIDPKQPKGYFDPETNEPIEGFTPGAAPVAQRLYGAVLGYYYKFLGQGLSDKEARVKAGEMFTEREGVHLGRVQQQAAIDQALSTIGLGPGFKKGGPSETPKSETAPASKGEPASRGSDPNSAPPKGAGAAATPAPKQVSSSVSDYLGSVAGNLKGGGKATVRLMKGRDELAKAMGVNPVQLDTALAENGALRKQLGETIQRQFAIDRLQRTLDAHGKNFLDAAEKIIQTGTPLANAPIRSLDRILAGSPELAQYKIFANAVQREYGQLTQGGAQSRAMLPVATSHSMEDLFRADATLPEVVAAVKATQLEAKTEREAMEKTKQDIRDEINQGAVNQAVSPNGKLSPPSAPAKKKIWDEKSQTFKDQ